MSETKEKPILFSAPMVKAILSGAKTQTRRIVSPHNSEFGSINTRRFWDHADFAAPHPGTLIDGTGNPNWYLHIPCHCQDNPNYPLSRHVNCDYCREWGWEGTHHRLYCKWEAGDRLWIKTGYSTRYDALREETAWSIGAAFTRTHGRAYSKSGKPKRDGNHPGMFMPRWLSDDVRFPVLEITGVRVERLNDISEEDAIAEGAQCAGVPASLTNRGAFAKLWNQINGSNSWAQNPFVWVIEFRNQ